ncbi:MAG TPA: homoserine kinase [Rectinemataceae bacterium]|nr:homoserine kinase [Rectinemataceae bacterium]
MRLELRVPATTANIGPGFDSLGIALSLYNSFTLERAGRTEVRGCEEKYAGPDNLFLRAMRHASRLLGRPAPEVCLAIDAKIPMARGLGSSAAMIVGGVAAAVLLDESRDAREGPGPEERRFILDASAALEGHPDNAAPAVYGGFCASIALRGEPGSAAAAVTMDGVGTGLQRILSSKSEVDPGWGFHALIPPFELSTREARAALPAVLPRADAVFNLGRAALVALAFEKRDAAMLGVACDDKMHQPYRMALIPGYNAVTEACREAGAKAVWLSGAGPTILALTVGGEDNQRFARMMAPVLASRPEGPWRHEILAADPAGLSCRFE